MTKLAHRIKVRTRLEEDLIFVGKWKVTCKLNGRRPQLFKQTEDNLNFKANGSIPQGFIQTEDDLNFLGKLKTTPTLANYNLT